MITSNADAFWIKLNASSALSHSTTSCFARRNTRVIASRNSGLSSMNNIFMGLRVNHNLECDGWIIRIYGWDKSHQTIVLLHNSLSQPQSYSGTIDLIFRGVHTTVILLE